MRFHIKFLPEEGQTDRYIPFMIFNSTDGKGKVYKAATLKVEGTLIFSFDEHGRKVFTLRPGSRLSIKKRVNSIGNWRTVIITGTTEEK